MAKTPQNLHTQTGQGHRAADIEGAQDDSLEELRAHRRRARMLTASEMVMMMMLLLVLLYIRYLAFALWPEERTEKKDSVKPSKEVRTLLSVPV